MLLPPRGLSKALAQLASLSHCRIPQRPARAAACLMVAPRLLFLASRSWEWKLCAGNLTLVKRLGNADFTQSRNVIYRAGNKKPRPVFLYASELGLRPLLRVAQRGGRYRTCTPTFRWSKHLIWTPPC